MIRDGEPVEVTTAEVLADDLLLLLKRLRQPVPEAKSYDARRR